MTHPKPKTKRMVTKADRRGKWARDQWIRILELLANMPPDERARCLSATVQFFKGRAS